MSPPQGWGVLVGRVMDTHGKPLSHYKVNVYSEATGQLRTVKTYGGGATNNDPYYDENMVLSDLPAGLYKIVLNFEKKNQQYWVTIYPGQVTYFTFEGEIGFGTSLPPTPSVVVTAIPSLTPAP